MDGRFPRVGDQLRRGAGQAQDKLVEEPGFRKGRLDPVTRGKGFESALGVSPGRSAGFGEAFRSPLEQGRTGEGGDVRLVGTDVGSRLVPSDVLFPCREYEQVGVPAAEVLSLPDESARGLADVVFVLRRQSDAEDPQPGPP